MFENQIKSEELSYGWSVQFQAQPGCANPTGDGSATTAEVWTGCGKAAPSSQVNRPAVELHVHSPEPTPGNGRSLLLGIDPEENL